MTEPVPTPAVTWGRRALRRVGLTAGAVVVVSGVGPAIANAAGGHVANPISIALRASGRTLTSLTTSDSVADAPSCTPTTASAPASASADPVETVTPVETVLPTASASESAEPDETVSESESEAPEPADECESEAPESESPESPEPSESPEADDAGHGEVVATVAHCAPHGKDPLLDVAGAPGNHGAYVQVAAHGDSIATPWGTFDLADQAGADALCAALDAARAALPPAPAPVHGKAARAKPAKAAHRKGAKGGRPEHAGKGGHGKHGEDAEHEGDAGDAGDAEHAES
jgi:hypothetical protein